MSIPTFKFKRKKLNKTNNTKKMRKLIMSMSLLLFAATSFAVPAKRGVIRQVTQSDGTKLNIELRGDEFLHYYVTDDNIPVVQLTNGGDFTYAKIENNQFEATGEIAHASANRSAREKSVLKTIDYSGESLANAAMNAKAKFFPEGQSQAPRRLTGTKRGLVILVNFSDNKFSMANPKAFYEPFFNKVGYAEHNQHGSVHDYFLSQSYDKFSLDFDVMGPITLAHDMAYYGANTASDHDKNPGEMIVEACKAVKDSVNFKDYDWDGNGLVDQVFVVYAGYGEAGGADGNTIWPHEWQLQYAVGNKLYLDGVYINTYACSCELSGSTGTTYDGVGTTCHEFSHCLGLPDFYDTNGVNFGMSTWDLLDYGCYNGNDNGDCPSGYTSYERMFCGWLKPIVLNNDTSITNMKALTNGGEAYILYNDDYKNEYFLLENRQKTGWDSSQYGHGMLVIHVDYSSSVWEGNTVNSEATHQRMTIVPADGTFTVTQNGQTYYTLPGDPYPGTSGNSAIKSFTTYYKWTAPSGLKTSRMAKPISDITEANRMISFNYSNPLTGIEDVIASGSKTTPTAIYTINGMKVNATSTEGLPKGIYVVSDAKGKHKVAVK
jgi:immune inhibitor A